MQVVEKTVKLRTLGDDGDGREKRLKLCLKILNLITRHQNVFLDASQLIRRTLEESIIFDAKKWPGLCKTLQLGTQPGEIMEDYTFEGVLKNLYFFHTQKCGNMEGQISGLTESSRNDRHALRKLQASVLNMETKYKFQISELNRKIETMEADTSFEIKSSDDKEKTLRMELALIQDELDLEKDKFSKEFSENGDFIESLTSKFKLRITELEINEKTYAKSLNEVSSQTKEINEKYQEMLIRFKAATDKVTELSREKEDLHNEMIVIRRTIGEPSRTLTPRPDFGKCLDMWKVEGGPEVENFELEFGEAFLEGGTEARVQGLIGMVWAERGKARDKNVKIAVKEINETPKEGLAKDMEKSGNGKPAGKPELSKKKSK
jgi:hypothetical protein